MERKAERQKHQRQSHTNWLPAAAAPATKMCGMKQANNTDNCGSAAGSDVERSHMQRAAKALSEANVKNISKTKTKSMYSHMQPHMCMCVCVCMRGSLRAAGSWAATQRQRQRLRSERQSNETLRMSVTKRREEYIKAASYHINCH